MKWQRIAAIIVLLLLAFDLTFSVLATCQSASYGYRGHCSAFGGPFVGISRFALSHIVGFLRDFEHELVAGFTIVLGVSTVLLWVATRNLWSETRDAAKRQEQQIRILQRAFVHVQTINWVKVDEIIKITPFWENSGATPTRNLRIRTNWAEGRNIPMRGFGYSYDDEPVRMFLGPKGVSGAGDINVPMALVDKILSGDSDVIIWGRADYDDIFGGPGHFIEFCAAVKIEFQSGAKTFLVGFPYVGPHNRSDEDPAN